MNENIVLVVVSFVSQKLTIFMVFLFDEKQYLKYKKLHKTVNRFIMELSVYLSKHYHKTITTRNIKNIIV